MRIGRVTRILARPAGLPSCYGRPSRGLDALLCGGCGAVMPPPVPGRLAQRESASFTPRRSLVRSQYRPRAGVACLLPFGQLRRWPRYLPGAEPPDPRNWWLRSAVSASPRNGLRSPWLVVAVWDPVLLVSRFRSRNWWLGLGGPVSLSYGLKRSADCVGSRRASPGGLDPRGPRDSWHRLQFSFC